MLGIHGGSLSARLLVGRDDRQEPRRKADVARLPPDIREDWRVLACDALRPALRYTRGIPLVLLPALRNDAMHDGGAIHRGAVGGRKLKAQAQPRGGSSGRGGQDSSRQHLGRR